MSDAESDVTMEREVRKKLEDAAQLALMMEERLRTKESGGILKVEKVKESVLPRAPEGT